jgi:hypothetical protein
MHRLALTSPARAGRASYLAEATLAGHNDPGAEAVALLFENIAASPTAWPAFLARVTPVLGMAGSVISLGIEATANTIRARTGRTSYLTEATLAGHNDPGAEAVALLFENIAAKSTA